LSFAQERLWFTEQWTNERAVYNIPLVLRLRGPLKLAALEKCLDEIVRRHEVLRTSFRMLDGKPRQIIAPARRSWLPVVDLSELSEAEREVESRRLSEEQSQQPFDLSQGPLLRILVLALDEREQGCEAAGLAKGRMVAATAPPRDAVIRLHVQLRRVH